MPEFTLHPQLQKDTIVVGRFPLCLLLLHRDANYPWFILVPQRGDLTEMHQLSEDDRAQLTAESCVLSEVLEKVFEADKLNLAALGNMVPQLHYHHIVRYHGDPAWPAPVWGEVPAVPYQKDELAERLATIREGLADSEFVSAHK
ncbi:HIT domain-containing protein [Porticoccus sp. W117]|uniref:HIT family protein n=1 Tax=Porticoccus sp. W117 TaxID=3054777 RepID=UPI002598F25C|nr:HIT domain-containing protein [Porticoccus sp. W117]MDM3869992.1 HIT domain-containing protein [Porticoccus sp. W117]